MELAVGAKNAVWNETTWQIAQSKLLKKVDEHKLGIRCVPRPTERLGRGGGTARGYFPGPHEAFFIFTFVGCVFVLIIFLLRFPLHYLNELTLE